MIKPDLKNRKSRIITLIILILGLLSLNFLVQSSKNLNSKAVLDTSRVFQITEPSGQAVNCTQTNNVVVCQTDQPVVNFNLNQNGLNDIRNQLSQ